MSNVSRMLLVLAVVSIGLAPSLASAKKCSGSEFSIAKAAIGLYLLDEIEEFDLSDEELFDEIDRNGKRGISLGEFKKEMKNLDEKVSGNCLKEVFEHINDDGDNDIDIDEFSDFLDEIEDIIDFD